jgi:hypothetical protein
MPSLASVGEYRTVVPKKGVYIHVRKKPTGKLGAEFLRRTKARARATGKPIVERLPVSKKRSTVVHAHYRHRKGKPVFTKTHRRRRKTK